jgi:indole-3-glycerol phosphate synthase
MSETDIKGMAAHAARRVERLKVQFPVEQLRALPGYARTPRDFAPALKGVCMDLRFATPGIGLLVSGGEVTVEYAAKRAVSALGRGATGIGVWTERNFHAGDYPHLDAAREACPDVLIAMMDYVVDVWQLERARAGGADAVLLIPELLGPYLERMKASARELGLAPVAWDDGGSPRLL